MSRFTLIVCQFFFSEGHTFEVVFVHIALNIVFYNKIKWCNQKIGRKYVRKPKCYKAFTDDLSMTSAKFLFSQAQFILHESTFFHHFWMFVLLIFLALLSSIWAIIKAFNTPRIACLHGLWSCPNAIILILHVSPIKVNNLVFIWYFAIEWLVSKIKL